MRRALAAATLLSAALGTAQPLPIGPEFRVNTATTNSQDHPTVGADSAANFVVVWADGGFIFGQRFDSSSAPLGSEFRVDTSTSAFAESPSVSRNVSGFVVVWDNRDGSNQGVFGRRFDSSGTPFAEFRVNTYTTTNQSQQAVSLDPDTGGFVVVWKDSKDGSSDVYAQRYDVSGVPLGPNFRVNTYTTAFQGSPSVAFSRFSSFVIVWEGQSGSDSSSIFAQRYLPSGAPVDSEFRVNTTTSGIQTTASVAIDAVQRFVVAWQDHSTDPNGDIRAQRFLADGTPAGTDFLVNTYTTLNQTAPRLFADSANFVIAWNSYGQDGSNSGIFARRFSAEGVPKGSEFRVNTYTTDLQGDPSITRSGSGLFVVVWRSDSQDGSSAGVYAQRFCLPRGDADGNGIIDVADVFYLINSLFAGGPAPVFNSDVNTTGATDVGDVFYVINYLFAGGPQPDCA